MTYADHAFEYFKKGYAPLWLPARKKYPPPADYTGERGFWPSGADIQEWVEAHGDGNIALRLPLNVVCLDVDAYSEGKNVLQTMQEAVEKLGPLPNIGRSTSRLDDPLSGHRLFRLPDDKVGTKFVGNLLAAGYGPGIDVVQYSHRYLVAPPSIHPDTGVAYTWLDAEGRPASFPAVDDLPLLPDSWIEGLTKKTIERDEVTDTRSYDEMPPELQVDVDEWCRDVLEQIYADLDDMKTWVADGLVHKSKHETIRVSGWEEGSFYLSGQVATLVKAGWNGLVEEEVKREWCKHVPHDSGKPLTVQLDKLTRSLQNDAMPPRPMPTNLGRDDSWWDEWGDVRPVERAEAEVIDPPETWPKRPMTELGNIQRAVEGVVGRIIFVTDGDNPRWLEYRDGVWTAAGSLDPEDIAAAWVDRAFTQALEHETEKYDDADEVGSNGKVKPGSSERAKFRHWMGNQFSSQVTKRTAVSLRRRARDNDLGVRATALDADPFDFAVRNGVLDLRTGELRDARPLDFITKTSPVVYDPEAKAPTFERYLETSLPDPEIREYLQKIIGYSLTNSTLEQAFFIHYGPTSSNGKSVLINMMEKILGDYFSPASSKALLTSKNDKIGQDFIDLAGPRFLSLSETKQGAALDEAAVKSLTAGDWRADRAHYSGNEKYRVTGKMHIATNAMPHMNPDEAMKRRLHLVPWTVSFAGGKGDPMLEDKLARELPGILAWAVRGAVAWYTQFKADGTGLVKPLAAENALESYLTDEDEVDRWRRDCTIEVPRGDGESKQAWTHSLELYQSYQGWATAEGVPFARQMQKPTFDRRLGKLRSTLPPHGKLESSVAKVDGKSKRVWPLRIDSRSSVLDPFS